MAYNNFLLRSLFSILFILTYIFISYFNFNLIFYLFLFVYLLIFIEIYLYFKKYNLLPLLYTLISLIFFFFLKFDNENFLDFSIFIFIVVVFDIFSYIIGKLLGKNKFIKISPNKTIEGFVGGVIFSLFFTLILSYNFNLEININFVSYIVIIIIFAFTGDIIESFFKRKNNLKNSSQLIPGHGGIFDRFDSFLFAIIFYSITNYILL
tara:strand:- start:96 stop:719 length:624 start_codon:yes stop_codon:yes gene_type:complete